MATNGDANGDGAADTVPVCPDCDNSSIHARTANPHHSTVSRGERWHCPDCGAYFNTPAYREPAPTTTWPPANLGVDLPTGGDDA